MTELQKTQAAYAHFTLEQWQLLARCVNHAYGDTVGTKAEIPVDEYYGLLEKFPSAVL